MNPGRLSHLVEIQNFTQSQNEFGERVEEWQTFKRAWANIKPISSKEFVENTINGFNVTHKILIRYIDGVSNEMRVVYNNRVFEIVGMRNLEEKNKYIEIICKELKNG